MMNKKGSILLIVLWIMAALVIFAVGLGHRASVNLQLVKYQRNRLRANYLARAAVNRALFELDDDTNSYDSLDETWSTGTSGSKKILEDIVIKDEYPGKFSVKYLYDVDKDEYRCMQDEESKININQVDDFGKKQIIGLLTELGGLNPTDAAELKDTIVEWINPAQEPDPAKKVFKNAALKAPEELLFILEYFYEAKEGKDRAREAAQKIFKSIRDSITVCGDGKININTATRPILRNTASVMSTETGVVENLLNRIIEFRSSSSGPFKAQTEVDTFCSTTLTDLKEQTLCSQIKDHLTVSSTCFRIPAHAEVGNIPKNITALYDKKNKEMLYWHED